MLSNIKSTIENHRPKPLGSQKSFAVLLPLVHVDGETHLLYEVRSNHISQPGETSFPGGKVETNETFEEAAIRETHEELNISKNQIEVYGEIDYIVNDAQVIHCFIGYLHDINVDQLQWNEEVERIFTVPLKHFLNHKPIFFKVSAKHSFQEDFPLHLINNGKDYKFSKIQRSVPFYDIPGEVLWGYTAQFTYEFSKIIQAN